MPTSSSRWSWNAERQEFIADAVGHPPHWVRGARAVHCCNGACGEDDFPGRLPRVGDIALCGAGYVGVITDHELQEVVYPDGNAVMAYVGYHLSSGKAGEPWSSRNPCIISTSLSMAKQPGEQIQNFVNRMRPQGWPVVIRRTMRC